MGIVHTPRAVASIAKGFWKKWRSPTEGIPTGIGKDNPHCYTARLGLFDVDYIGHMNNAAYLSHAEYARWEMCAENGLIGGMLKSKSNFIVVGSTIRFRKEIRPIFANFSIDSTVYGVDERIIWIQQNFKSSKSPRIATQILVQGAAIRGREVLNPIEFFKNDMGLDPGTVDRLTISQDDVASVSQQFKSYAQLDEAMKMAAAIDDERHADAKRR